jgi:hypothetical protein
MYLKSFPLSNKSITTRWRNRCKVSGLQFPAKDKAFFITFASDLAKYFSPAMYPSFNTREQLYKGTTLRGND